MAVRLREGNFFVGYIRDRLDSEESIYSELFGSLGPVSRLLFWKLAKISEGGAPFRRGTGGEEMG